MIVTGVLEFLELKLEPDRSNDMNQHRLIPVFIDLHFNSLCCHIIWHVIPWKGQIGRWHSVACDRIEMGDRKMTHNVTCYTDELADKEMI